MPTNPSDMTSAEIRAEVAANSDAIKAHLVTLQAAEDQGAETVTELCLSMIEQLTNRISALVAELISRG